MPKLQELLIFVAGFAVIAVASQQIARLFPRIKLPLLTGLLVTGLFSGPFVLKLIPATAVTQLNFLQEVSLAFIAFAAGTELYLRELTRYFKSILWNTFGQLVVTFVVSSVAVYLIADVVPFMQDYSSQSKWGMAILSATIFVARSPSSAIALINELRAKGPFTQNVLGVTVIIDLLVIILFAICFPLAQTLDSNSSFQISIIGVLLLELIASFGLGIGLGKFMAFVLSLKTNQNAKTAALLLLGYGVFFGAHQLQYYSHKALPFDIHLEPLLICIIAAFVVTNFTSQRPQFQDLIERVSSVIYVIFFTLIGPPSICQFWCR